MSALQLRWMYVATRRDLRSQTLPLLPVNLSIHFVRLDLCFRPGLHLQHLLRSQQQDKSSHLEALKALSPVMSYQTWWNPPNHQFFLCPMWSQPCYAPGIRQHQRCLCLCLCASLPWTGRSLLRLQTLLEHLRHCLCLFEHLCPCHYHCHCH